jgi:hypothetical protein
MSDPDRGLDPTFLGTEHWSYAYDNANVIANWLENKGRSGIAWRPGRGEGSVSGRADMITSALR